MKKGERMSEAAKAHLRSMALARDIRGEKNPKWRGGRVQFDDGRIAVYAPGHPGANLLGGTHILEYRLIAAEKLGRPLSDEEIVHHINGDPTDNRPENLEVMTQSDHARLHSAGRRDPTTGRFTSEVEI